LTISDTLFKPLLRHSAVSHFK